MSLTQYLASLPTTPFDWQTYNCCHFAARWVELVTGKNPMAGLEPTADLRAARKLIKSLGGSMVDAWTKQLGYGPLVTPNLAQIGDVVLLPIDENGAEAVGVCAGGIAAFVTDQGHVCFIQMDQVTHAWRITPCRA